MGLVVGTIVDEEGEPIAEATVMVVAGPTHTDLAAVTDENGDFQLGLDPGLYKLEFHKEDFRTARGRVRVRPQGRTRVRVRLLPDY